MKTTKEKTLTALCLSVFFALGGLAPADISAQGATWSSVGPDGGNVAGLVSISSSSFLELYAVVKSFPAQVFKSTSGGSTWTRIATIQDTIYDLKNAPSSPNTFYALAKGAVYKSLNKGLTWTRHNLPSNCFGDKGQLAIQPTTPNFLYVASYRLYDVANNKTCIAVLKSTNGGQTWSFRTLAQTGSNSGFASCLALSKLNANLVFTGGVFNDASGDHFRIYKSTDGGINYLNKTGTINTLPLSIVTHPADMNRALVGTAVGIYRTTNGGDAWLKNNGSAFAFSLALDNVNSQVVYGGYDKEIYKSTNGGADWTKYVGLLGVCTDLLANSSTVYFASTAGVFKSSTGGTSWAGAIGGMKAAEIPGVAVAFSSSNIVYAGVKNNGIFRSIDSGTSWTRTPLFPGADAITRIAVNQGNPSLLYALASVPGPNLVYESNDGGDNWMVILTDFCQDMAVSRLNFARLFLAGQKLVGSNFFLALHKSTDRGVTWSHIQISATAGTSGNAVAVQPSNDNVILVGGQLATGGILYKSTNGGSSWVRITGTIKGIVRAITFDPNSVSRIYVGADDGFYKSENGGSSWTRKLNRGIRCIQVNPLTPNVVFAGGPEGVFKSSDSGNTWKDFNQTIPARTVYGMDIDGAHRILYAATIGGSVCIRALF